MEKIKLFSITSADVEWQTFRSGGKGGQNQNKVETGVRVIHRPSGSVGESRETRSQLTNKQRAFGRMANSEKFQKWCRLKAAEILGKLQPQEIKKRVEMLMEPKNIKIECGDGYHWEEME